MIVTIRDGRDFDFFQLTPLGNLLPSSTSPSIEFSLSNGNLERTARHVHLGNVTMHHLCPEALVEAAQKERKMQGSMGGNDDDRSGTRYPYIARMTRR